VAVYSSDERIDPVGACVGIKGVRVQSIVRELNNERIDIVPWASNPELFVTRALAPAKVTNIDVFMLEKKMTVAVEDEKLSLAIGRNGQNARLASKLTGWKVNILSETEYNEKRRREAEMLVPVGQLEGVGEKIRNRLVDADISSVQRLSEASVDTLTKIEGLGPKTAETLIERAKEFVRKLEEEHEAKKAELLQAEQEAAAGESEEGELSEEDVVEDDENYVTEADDTREATAPAVDLEENDGDQDADEDDTKSAAAPVESSEDTGEHTEQEDKESA
jgi:N utilization substance protein A